MFIAGIFARSLAEIVSTEDVSLRFFRGSVTDDYNLVDIGVSLLQDNGNVRSVSCNLFLQCLIAEAGYNQSAVFICRQLEP